MALAVTPSPATATASTTRNARVIEDPPCRAAATGSSLGQKRSNGQGATPDGRHRDPPPHRRAGGRGARAGARPHRAGALRRRAGAAGRPRRAARPLLGPAAPARRGELAAEVATALRARGRPTVVVDAADFLRPASVRLEQGRTDPDALLH